MEKEDDEHTAESVGSNSSQNQSIKKHTAGKRKRETDADSSACSFIMVHPKCQDRGPPNFPSLRERESWNLYDKKFVHTEYISKSSMTSDNSNKRICVRTEVNPQPSEVPSLEELFRGPRVLAESNGDWVISMMNHYDFPSDIKSMLAAKLLDNPSMFPLMVGFDEKTLLSSLGQCHIKVCLTLGNGMDCKELKLRPQNVTCLNIL